jgi:translocation and assembly module TamB
VTASSGTATIEATVKGPLENPQLSGTANIEKGEFRWGTMPRLEAINGPLTFDGNGVNADGLRARIGTGAVVFGGNLLVDLNEFRRSTYDLTATGKSMVIRYPEGFQSKVDADLTLTGPITTPTLAGTVTVISATYVKRFDTDTAAFLGLAGGPETSLAPPVVEGPDEGGAVLTTDVHIVAPRSTLHIDSGPGTHIEGSGFLDYKAEGDRASILGRIEIDRGWVTWNSNKFVLQSAKIGFDNPSRIEPNFAVSAAVRPHAPGQTFDVGINISGTMSKLNLNLSSDPWLPQADIIRLLLGESLDQNTAAETRAYQTGAAAQRQSDQVIQSAAAQFLLAPISSRVVSSVIGDIPGAPTVSISPVIGANISTTATARVVVGKQISNNIYISYTRTLNQTTEFILLEIEQNERLSWIISKNEDQTFALDFRIRHVF